MKKENVFKGGIRNPLASKRAHFDYEVVEQSEVTNSEWQENGETYSMPECTLLLQSLNGGYVLSERFYCTVYGKEATKHLRAGELITADFRFHVRKNDDGTYTQQVTAQDVFTLNEYQLIREAEAIYENRLKAEREKV